MKIENLTSYFFIKLVVTMSQFQKIFYCNSFHYGANPEYVCFAGIADLDNKKVQKTEFIGHLTQHEFDTTIKGQYPFQICKNNEKS